jgi:thiamine-phosphate pyrophosphorylase
MKIIVISPSRTTDNELKTVTALFEHGLQIFHLRKPSMRTNEMKEYIEAIPSIFHNRIIIHSHHKLASTFDLRGIHLTKAHFRKKLLLWWRLRSLLLKKPNISVSTSFHKLLSVYDAEPRFAYAFLGVIFDKVSGKFNAGYSRHSLEAAIAKTKNKLIARGGTDISNIETCRDIGFYGVAYSSAIWKSEDPVKTFCAIKDRFRELNIPAE